ncbi:unnamed protein product [Miscanthus lutarioriparius]|uniref:Uncharacterized protein n=1 Tax=Miscanthus lutarioriparius TaxID=422564 RepID=A0A811RXV7_9POAL|nr:unnamed protein product [Miscanthus lutarioriparius]
MAMARSREQGPPELQRGGVFFLSIHLSSLPLFFKNGSETSIKITKTENWPFMEWRLSNRKRVDKHLRRGFDSIVFLIGWMLRKQRNARTFDGSTRTARELAVDIRLIAEDWRMAGYRQLGILLSGH